MAKPLKRIRAKRLVRSDIKLKTNKRAAKAYKVLASGKVKAYRSNRSHNTGKRSASRMNRLSKPRLVSETKMKIIQRIMPYSF